MRKAQPKAYSLEFREEEMRQLLSGTKPIKLLAKELGGACGDAPQLATRCTGGPYDAPGSTAKGV